MESSLTAIMFLWRTVKLHRVYWLKDPRRQLDVRQSLASGISACARMSQSYWSLRLLKLFLGTTYETLKQGAKTPEHLEVIKLPMLGGQAMQIYGDFQRFPV